MNKLVKTLLILFLSTIAFGQTNPYDLVTKQAPFEPENPSQINKRLSNFSKQFQYLNPSDWNPGMRFITNPMRGEDKQAYLPMGLVPYLSENHDLLSRIESQDFQWKIFTYRGLEVRDGECYGLQLTLKPKCPLTYLIFECEGKKYEFEYRGDTTKLRQDTEYSNVGRLVYLDEVDIVKSQLEGKTLFIKTSEWMKDTEVGPVTTSDHPRFVPVIVTGVGVGTQDAPSKIVFNQAKGEGEEFFLNVRLSGINSSSARQMSKDFDDVFQFTNPRLDYPKISDGVWSLILQGKVRLGMTKFECDMSWGRPDDINRNNWKPRLRTMGLP